MVAFEDDVSLVHFRGPQRAEQRALDLLVQQEAVIPTVDHLDRDRAAAGASTYDYLYGTTSIEAAAASAIPTATLPGLLLFGALLAGIGVSLLFRS